ncbi:MAG: serine/threonine-protein kinase [Minicystis sp.]
MVGSTIDGRYLVLRVLGEGGMGAVYEARHTGTGRRVALKVIRGQVAGSAEMVQRFQREARMVGALDTPHVVAVFDTGTDPATGLVYMAMELLQGEDLRALLKRCRRLKPEVAMRLVAQACRGLGKAHEASVIHRDIKPANLFLSCLEGGEIVVKVVDFGIAKALGASNELGATLTRTGSVLGSPHYMSPEQAKGRKTLDHRTDIWSLGVVLYQCLSGRVPHVREENELELMLRICTQAAPPIQSIAPWVPPGVAVLVHRMLSIDPDARFQSAAEVIAAMRPWLGDDHRVHAGELVAITDAEAAQVAPRAALPEDDATVRDHRSLMVPAAQAAQAPHGGAASSASPRPTGLETTERAAPSAATALAVPRTDALTASSLQTFGVSQDTTTLLIPKPKSRLRPAVAIPIAFAVGIGGQFAYRLIDRPALASADARASAGPAMTDSATPVKASAEAPKPSAAPVEERTVRVAVEPADATAEIDGQQVPVRDGAIELRGALGSVHSVRLVKGAQEATAGVAITPVGAVPARMRIEPKPGAQARPTSKALNRRFE